MHPARRCSSALAALLCVSSSSARRGPNAARRVCCPSSSSLSGTAGGGGGGEESISAGTIIKTQVVKTSSITTRPGPGPGPAAAGAVCPMGSSSSSSSSRLFGTLAHQSLSSPPLDQHHLYPTPEQEGPDADPDGLAGQADPDQLLRECEQALQKRPARPHRDLVYPGGVGAAGQAHRHNDHDPGPSIRVLQWNILAQALGEGKDGFVRCPLDALNWQERKYLILEEILTYRPDVVCLQEVDHYFDTFQPVMSSLGYHGSFMAKPWSPCLDVARNNGPDGCALFYRRSRFTLLATAHLRLAAMMLPTNQVAIVQTLRCRVTQRQLCVAVTHLKARSGWERLRSAQGADLLQNLRSITSQAAAATARSGSTGGPGAVGSGGVPLIVCGDFNAEPSEDVYRRFSSSPLGLESAYKLLSADGQTEPAYTTWKIRPSGESCSTLDYIWYTQNALRVDTLLDLPSEEDIGPDRLPSYHYPSDHISLLCDISFTQPSSHRLM